MRLTPRLFADLVKFEHTVFALPFAYVGCLMGANGHPTWAQCTWVTVAMVAARTAGMTVNRLVDRHIDARNPRTATRALPAGRVTPQTARLVVIVSLALLVLSAACLNPLALTLSPIAVGLLVLYSHLKRFTPFAHLGLGLVLSCAPAGGWIAVRGALGLAPCLVVAAVFLWVAGFDILYACLDVDFDRAEHLHSVPARWGVAAALNVARIMHIGTVFLLTIAGVVLLMGPLYFAGIGVVSVLLGYEHTLVSPTDLSKMNQAFFAMNGWVSVTLLAFTWLSYHFTSGDALVLWTLH